MLSHEMQMKTIANDRFTARMREAEVHRSTKKNRRPNLLVTAIGKTTMVVRNAVAPLSTAKSLTINGRRVLS